MQLQSQTAKSLEQQSRRLLKTQIKMATLLWTPLSKIALQALRELITAFQLSVGSGDLLYLEAKWYVTHAGLLRLARRRRCAGIHVQAIAGFSDPAARRWAFKATVYKSRTCRGFVGYGDADPSNVSSLVRGAEMRVAETRAVNRALRKAYGIGICSVEEIGSFAGPVESGKPPKKTARPVNEHENNGQTRL